MFSCIRLLPVPTMEKRCRATLAKLLITVFRSDKLHLILNFNYKTMQVMNIYEKCSHGTIVF